MPTSWRPAAGRSPCSRGRMQGFQEQTIYSPLVQPVFTRYTPECTLLNVQESLLSTGKSCAQEYTNTYGGKQNSEPNDIQSQRYKISHMSPRQIKQQDSSPA